MMPDTKHLRIIFYVITGAMLLVLGLTWIRRDMRIREAKEFEQRALLHLEEIERQIEITMRELEAIRALPPEEERKREEARDILSAQHVEEDIFVKGTEITSGEKEKVFINRTYGYRITLPDNLVVARSITPERIELHDQKFMCEGDPLCDPIIRIEVKSAGNNIATLEEWFSREEKKAGASIYSPRKRLMINGVSVWRVEEDIPRRFDGYYYYWMRGTDVYSLRISKFDDPTYQSVIASFRFEQ